MLCAAGPDSFRARFNLPRDPDAVLNEVIAWKEFRENSIRAAFERIVERIEKLVDEALRRVWRALPRLRSPDAAYDPIWIFLATMLVGSIVTILVLLGKRFIANIARRYGVARSGLSIVDGKQFEDSRHLLNQAAKAAENGDYATALVFLFRFSLVRLDETGQLSLHPGRTNKEILENIPRDAPIRHGLAEMVPVFDRVRYGHGSCGRDDYEHFFAMCMLVTGRNEVHVA
jgi:hypothetical protein